MPDVAGSTELVWGTSTPVASAGLDILWGFATLVTSIGGTFTPGAPPPGSTPTAPNTDADFVIPAATNYRVTHVVTVTDLRDSLPLELDTLSLSCDDGSICWTLNATGARDLFQRLTTGDTPVLDVVIDGYTWRFIIEGVRRERTFPAGGVSITGRSPTIVAGEPYQFPQNWVNDGPATAQQLAAQAQVFTGLEIDWQLEDWLVPDRVFSFSGSPLAVIQRVAESVSAVTRADHVESKVALLPRYRALPNEWREQVPEVEIHIDVSMTDSWERADKPAYTGVYVSGQAQGAIAKVYLAGTTGDQLAPMITDALLTESAALRQRGEAFLGQGGPQATIRITMPFLTGGTYPGPIEVNWLVRVVEAGPLVYYGVVRAVSIEVNFGVVTQTITIEHHTKDITGTTTLIPAPPAPVDGEIAWFDPIGASGGTLIHANSGSGVCDSFAIGSPVTNLFAGLIGWTTETLVWSIASWTSAGGHPAPFINSSADGWVEIQWNNITGWDGGFPFVSGASIGTLVLTATVDGSPIATGQRLIAVTTPPTVDYADIAWGPE